MAAERDQRFELRLSPAELAAYRLVSDRAGVTLSDWIRTACGKLLDAPPRVESSRQRRARLLEEIGVEFRALDEIERAGF